MKEREARFHEKKPIGFEIREINNLIKAQIHRQDPDSEPPKAPLTQLQGGILGYLYHHDINEPVYQKNIEEVFRISRATATNTLQVMEKNGLIVRKAQDKDARLKRIIMTEEARCGHMRMEKRMQEFESRMLEGISEKELDELRELFSRIRDNLAHMSGDGGQESIDRNA